MEQIIPALDRTLFSPTYEISAEWAEIGLDSLLEDGVLRDIPVVNSLTAVCKIGYNLHERNLVKQLVNFLTTFNDGTIRPEQLKAHQLELEKNPKQAENELSRVLIVLGKQIEDIQSQVTGSFYKAYVKEEISWEQFCELSEANRRIFVADYEVLYDLIGDSEASFEVDNEYQTNRLFALGLVYQRGGNAGIYDVTGKPIGADKKISLTTLGKLFCRYDGLRI